jgi:hypothetical protein
VKVDFETNMTSDHLKTLTGQDLPTGFQFSQSSLQDFVDCRRRFYLRYIWQLAWPAIESEPAMQNERHLRQGAVFHQMVNQHLSGVPLKELNAQLPEEDQFLVSWWQNYVSHCGDMSRLHQLSGLDEVSGLFHEVSLSAPLGEYRLVAKYDLILLGANGQAVIVDWKTSTTTKQPNRQWLIKRLQTKVYPYLLSCAGETLNANKDIKPERISMLYWYANHPKKPIRFSYNDRAYQTGREYIEQLLTTILNLGMDEFDLTDDEKRCTYCVYRSLCDRGARAGVQEGLDAGFDQEGILDVDIDFEQIAEIEF